MTAAEKLTPYYNHPASLIMLAGRGCEGLVLVVEHHRELWWAMMTSLDGILGVEEVTRPAVLVCKRLDKLANVAYPTHQALLDASVRCQLGAGLPLTLESRRVFEAIRRTKGETP